ncbi:cytochrome P450 [Salinigranum halophilum]|uniref:cytochrome P450 n=1 Tax=Salinigranum halophilum TaxID=2565931 RepID=UPI0010A7A7A3|nr:cytochrome P450 [Salinigranum halophilum]
MRAPHSPPGDPVVGNALRFARSPFDFLDTLSSSYAEGVVHLSGMAGPGIYVVLDPDLVQRVLVDDHARYRKPQLRPELVDPLIGEGLLTSEGDLWKRQRTTLQPAFFTSRLRGFGDTIVDFTRATTAGWRDGGELDVHHELGVLTVRIISRLLLGVDLSRADAVDVAEAMERVGETLALSPGNVVRPPWLQTPPPREYRQAIRELEDVTARITAMHDPGGDDVLSLLQRAIGDDPDAFSADERRDQVMTMLLAGHETTALTLTYALSLLSATPDARAELRSEVDTVVDGTPAWGDLASLDYTERVVHETLRLLPPVWALFRQPLADARLGEYRIPEGAPMMLPQWALHRSRRHWDAPLTFDPDRWRETKPAEVAAYFPFGAGPRACIGRQLAIVEAKLILATLFAEWDVAVTVDELPRRAAITMQPTEPVPAVVRRR